jgi:excisionase family DNA binding protein
MTAEEVAQYLRVCEATVYRLASQGRIPAARIGRSWRFSREMLEEWFREQSGLGQTGEGL